MKHYIYKIAFLFIFFLISCNDEEPKIEPTDFTTEIADKNKAALIKENLQTFLILQKFQLLLLIIMKQIILVC